MSIFLGQVAIVTGAGSGIGRAIAISLCSHGAHVYLLGRTQRKLEETLGLLGDLRERVTLSPVDLTMDKDIQSVTDLVKTNHGRVDTLVHGAGVIQTGTVETADVRDFDYQYRTNLRAPFLLTQALLPMLKVGPGQIVFVNSSVATRAPGGVSQYSATKHGLKALADSLRDEVNQFGIRVLSVYPGRTATPTQARLYRMRNQKYAPELLLQPEDLASIIVSALSLPRTAEITDLSIRPLPNSY